MRLGPAIAAVAALSIITCGRVSYQGPVPAPAATPPTAALVPWQGFPAGQQPRPIVWLFNVSPSFANGEGKIAQACGKFVLGGSLPKNLPSQAIASWAGGTSASYAGISAAAALTAMSAIKVEMTDCATVNPLVISGARLGVANFYTDRGLAQMTSWMFSATGVDVDLAYPALVPTAFWKGGVSPQAGNGAADVSTDGRLLTWSFAGAPDNAGPCGADYEALVAESTTAVAVALKMTPHVSPGDDVACPAIAQMRTVAVPLSSPLGGRVVVDSSGYPVAVCPAAFQRGC